LTTIDRAGGDRGGGDDLAAAIEADSASREPDAVRAADALRRVIAWLVAAPTDATLEALPQVADGAEALAQSLPGEIGRSRISSDRTHTLARHPMLGRAHPLSPPLVLEAADGNGVAATATYTVAFEGPPGCVHGGHIAAAFDVVLAMAAARAGNPGLTGELTIRYLRPTPLHEPLRYEAEAGEQDGKRLTVHGRLLAFEDIVTAEAEATFVGQPGFEPGRFVAIS